MNTCALLLLAAIDLVSDGKPVLRIATDEHPQSVEAARTLERAVVLISGAALPTEGAGAPLRFERTDEPGYVIRRDGDGAVISGRDVLHAVYDLLEGWGCDLDGEKPRWAERASLSLEETEFRPKRRLLSAGTAPATRRHDGVTFELAEYDAVRETARANRETFGWEIRVESRSFDDFLPPALFEEHPEWFALRGGERAPRGNFSLLNTDARRHYLDAMSAWLADHPGSGRPVVVPEGDDGLVRAVPRDRRTGNLRIAVARGGGAPPGPAFRDPRDGIDAQTGARSGSEERVRSFSARAQGLGAPGDLRTRSGSEAVGHRESLDRARGRGRCRNRSGTGVLVRLALALPRRGARKREALPRRGTPERRTGAGAHLAARG